MLVALVSASAMAAPDRVIDCTDMHEALLFEIHESGLDLKFASTPCKKRLKLIKHAVQGVGDKARTEFVFQGARISFRENYGCLSKIKVSLNEKCGTFAKGANLECHYRQGLRCGADHQAEGKD